MSEMRKVKTVVHVKSQDEYDEVVNYFKNNGKIPFFAGEETAENIFDIYNIDTCIKITDEHILFGSLVQYGDNDEFNVVDFTAFKEDMDMGRFEGIERISSKRAKMAVEELVLSHCADEEFDREEVLHFTALAMPGILKNYSKSEIKSMAKIKEIAALSVLYAKECLSQINKLEQ